jgi:integrase
LQRRLIPDLGSLLVTEVDPGLIYDWLGQHPNVKLRRAVLGLVLQHAVRTRHLAANPMREVGRSPVRVGAKPARRPRALTRDDLDVLREAVQAWEDRENAIEGKRNTWMPLKDGILLQLATGTRIGELLAVRRCDVRIDTEKGTGLVAITGTMKPITGQGLVRGAVKTEQSEAAIPLPAVAVEMLAKRFMDTPDDVASLAPVLPSRAGTFIWPHNFRRAFREARSLATKDLSWVVPHSLRATAGSQAYHQGGLPMASAFMRNSEEVAERHYVDRGAVPDVTDALHCLLEGWSG